MLKKAFTVMKLPTRYPVIAFSERIETREFLRRTFVSVFGTNQTLSLLESKATTLPISEKPLGTKQGLFLATDQYPYSI